MAVRRLLAPRYASLSCLIGVGGSGPQDKLGSGSGADKNRAYQVFTRSKTAVQFMAVGR
jgi:hypothetical protein